MARISWLFANNEFSLVINIVGSSIENLPREIFPEKGAGVVTMVKALGIDVRRALDMKSLLTKAKRVLV